MLKQTSDDFRLFFLIEFTKELIKNSAKQDFFPDPFEIRQPQKIIKPYVKQLTPQEEQIPVMQKPVQQKKKLIPLRIPELSLPPQLQYLRPVPDTSQIELGKLNPLIKDPAVSLIECRGPGENIIVKVGMGIKPTSIVLNKEEISQALKAFSDAARIPVQKGVFKVAVGRLIFSAISSEITGSKFIISKMTYSGNQIFPNAR